MVVHTAYFDLEVHRPEDFVWYPHVWEEPQVPYLNQLTQPVDVAISIDGHAFIVSQTVLTLAQLLNLVASQSREFLERIVGDVTMASRENELLREELRLSVESEERLEQLRAKARIRESHVEAQIPIVDMPIEPMAPCVPMSA
jgi:hypothetical protein